MVDMEHNASAMKFQLARDLVDDVELSRLPSEYLLLKALRLARLADDSRAAEWIQFELNGYVNTERSKSWMRFFGRFTDEEHNLGWWLPLAAITGRSAVVQAQLGTLRVPDTHFAPSSANPNEWVTGFAGVTAQQATEPAKQALERLGVLTDQFTALAGIRSRVLAAVHSFAVDHYHRLAFSGLAETIFEKHRTAIDALMAAAAPEVLEKLPAVYDRLASGDSESISQAMNSVRRMIKAFADKMYPPADASATVGGTTYEVGSDKVLNRMELLVAQHCSSESRKGRLKRSLRDIHERVSAGSHSEITAEEARALLLGTYLLLGEILAICSEVPTALPAT